MTSDCVALSVDGKIITDLAVLEKFQPSLSNEKLALKNLTLSNNLAFADLEELEELHVAILPFIAGGLQKPTMTGFPGDFLKIPIKFSLVAKKVKKKICFLHYRRVAKKETLLH